MLSATTDAISSGWNRAFKTEPLMTAPNASTVRVRRRFRFEAAHRLPRHPGKCRELHGHSYELIVVVDRPVEPESGMVIDFSDLKQVVRREVH